MNLNEKPESSRLLETLSDSDRLSCNERIAQAEFRAHASAKDRSAQPRGGLSSWVGGALAVASAVVITVGILKVADSSVQSGIDSALAEATPSPTELRAPAGVSEVRDLSDVALVTRISSINVDASIAFLESLGFTKMVAPEGIYRMSMRGEGILEIVTSDSSKSLKSVVLSTDNIENLAVRASELGAPEQTLGELEDSFTVQVPGVGELTFTVR